MTATDVVEAEEFIEEPDSAAQSKASRPSATKWILLIVGCVLTLTVVRVGIVSNFDSMATRFACMNHAARLNSEALETASDDSALTWEVRRHIRSNKLGVFNRDDAACVLQNRNVGSSEKTFMMADVTPGSFYWFAKFLGIMLQIGLVAGFVRWFHFRFMDN